MLHCALLRRWLAGAFLLMGVTTLQASDITVAGAHTYVANNILMVDADASFNFSNDAIEAVNSGIPLTIELDVRISRPRKYWWNAAIFSAHRAYSIEHHALSEQFVLTDRVTGERRIHSSLELAIADLGRIRNLPVVELSELEDAASCEVGLRLRLDIESLPGPLIPLAYVSPGWHMSSGWHRWQTNL